MRARRRRSRSKRKINPATKVKIKLTQFAADANDGHREAVTRMKGMLQYVADAGHALRKAKRLVRHGEWQNWLRDDFEASYETAVVYMRVARDWDKEEFKKARLEGEINSIASFLSTASKGPGTEASAYNLPPLTDIEQRRIEIIDFFRTKLKRVKPKLVEVIDENVHDIWDAALSEARRFAFPPGTWERLQESRKEGPDPEDGRYISEEAEAEGVRMPPLDRSYGVALDDPNWDEGMFEKGETSHAA